MIEIQTLDLPLSFALRKDIPEGVQITVPPMRATRDAGSDMLVTILVTVGTGVPVGLLTNWLYDKLKNGRSNKISINHREIEITKGEITRIVEECIKIE
jgi:hypothetical protein